MIGSLKNKAIKEKTEKFLAHHYDPYPVSIEKVADDVRLQDADGSLFLDMVAQYSSVGFGHLQSRDILAAAQKRAGVAMVPGFLCNSIRADCAKALAKFTGMDKVVFMNSGAEAFDTAVKIARKWGKKFRKISETGEILFCRNAFHGRTVAAISASTTRKYYDDFRPFAPGFMAVKFGDLEDLERNIDDDTIAFVVEPIQGEGGINVPHREYLRDVKALCQENNMLFILDEVQTGFGRTGYDFAWHHEGEAAKPDIIMLGKMLGGGCFPVSVVAGREKVMSVLEPGDHGSTFGGSPIACAIVLEVLDRFKNNNGFLYDVREKGRYFINSLGGIIDKCRSPLFVEACGRGLMVGVKLNHDAAPYIQKKLLEKSVICGVAGTNHDVLRFSPPLIITKRDLEFALGKIADVFKTAAANYQINRRLV